MRRGAALFAAVLLAGLVAGCFGPTPRTASRTDAVVRVALGVVPASEVPERLQPDGTNLVRFKNKRYRGVLRSVNTDSGVLIVNVLPLEQYLKGVVPLELGERPAEERAALEAQAIAARSYTVSRLMNAKAGRSRSEHFDLVPSTADQVYGGADAERPNASAAVEATAGIVLRYGDRVITAPYSSACGGETALAQEVWQSQGEPYLQRVSDRIPGNDRYFCDIAPRFYWERTLTGSELSQVVSRYLGSITPVPSGGPGEVRGVRVAERFPSGRVKLLELRTGRGTFDLGGNEARSVLRTTSGEALPSSYFSVTVEGASTSITRVVLKGNGYGHGVGMCQWGAIGRARAGQSARSILRTYFPGTTLGSIPSL